MLKLSIITINYNNAEGLRKTLASVAAQTYPNIEHIIVDGNSTDGSVEVIEAYASGVACTASGCGIKDAVSAADAAVNSQPAKGAQLREATQPANGTLPAHSAHHQILWVSEKDKGIYNAMNKGIEIALGKRVVNDDHTSSPLATSLSPLVSKEYIQILNSGDILAAPNVTERMVVALQQCNSTANTVSDLQQAERAIYSENSERSTASVTSDLQNRIPIFYGNMIKVNAQGKIVGKSGYTEYSLRQFYSSTLNHDCAYIRKDLFEEYGLYDETLKIVSDWKWYLQVIGLGRVKPEYVKIDVTIFDDGGISEQNLPLRYAERRQVLEELLPPAVLWDYDTHAFEVEQMNRLRRWKLYPLVYFIERVCFKFEKWGFLRNK